jgi:hypothetical protein
MNNRKHYILLLVIGIYCALSPKKVIAQKTEIGAMAGAAFYYGDLNPRYGVRFPGGGGNMLLRQNFDGRMCVKGTIGYSYLWADDALSNSAYAQARNLRFFSHTYNGSVQLEFNFQPYHSANNYSSSKDKKVSPYLATGLSIVYFNPRAEYLGGIYSLRDMGTEGQPLGSEYAKVSPAWLLGGGVKFDVSKTWSVNIEMMGHLLFTDYLDDVSGTYADFSVVEGHHGTAAAALSDRSLEVPDATVRMGGAGRQRGDSRSKDAYLTIHIGLVYRFLQINCPAY